MDITVTIKNDDLVEMIRTHIKSQGMTLQNLKFEATPETQTSTSMVTAIATVKIAPASRP